MLDELKTQINKHKVVFDICLNIVASALPIAMLQLVIYPQIASALGGDAYGFMLTIYSVWIMIANSLGNVLNNIRLLRNPEYEAMGETGDILVLLRRWISVSSVVTFLLIWFYCGNFSIIHILAGSFISACILLKAYLEVGFRIQLNYVAILVNNILLCMGFFVGYRIFCVTNIWEFVFLGGYTSSCAYCIVKTGLLNEPIVKTRIYSSVYKDACSLALSSVINNLINYADKLVLYPLIGGTAVSIYYTATILGKITGMLTGPINSVILSYISRWDKSRTNVFSRILSLGLIVVILGYGLTVILARPVLGFLFPQWIEEVMSILPLTTITVMLNILITFLNPFVLKYCKMQWQIAISATGSIAYFMCALILWKHFGLKGFCIGTIIGVAIKLWIIIFVYYHSIKEI